MSSHDPIMQQFLQQTYAEACDLAAHSRVLSLVNVYGNPAPEKVLCYFHHLPHLVLRPNRTVDIVRGDIVLGIFFPPEYLRATDRWMPLHLISLLTPQWFFHPNVRVPVLCPGLHLYPGMSLTELIWHAYEILTYQNVNLDERDALNPEACRYLRLHPEVFEALRPPPLKQRRRVHTSTPGRPPSAEEA